MPEEINRIVADHTADLLFAPTGVAVNHLSTAGLADKTILTGDIMAASVQFVQDKITDNQYSGRDYYLLTMHRPYNVDDPARMKKLFADLAKLDQDLLSAI